MAHGVVEQIPDRLGVVGGLAGVILGTVATLAYTTVGGNAFAMPPSVMAAAGVAAATVIGAVAGLSPAARVRRRRGDRGAAA